VEYAGDTLTGLEEVVPLIHGIREVDGTGIQIDVDDFRPGNWDFSDGVLVL